MSSCTHCSKKKWYQASWVPAVAVAILPKCPFCIMAYAGAIPLCGGSTMYPNEGNSSLYITLGCSLIVLLGILLNRRGKRTWIAALIVLSGIVVLALSQVYWISMPLYYLGVITLFFGIWYNGSFAYFKRTYFHITSTLKFRTKM